MSLRARVAIVLLALVASSCAASTTHTASSPTGSVVAQSTIVTTTTKTAPELVLWKGPVEHLFFHTLVIHPQLAFTSEPIGQGFRDWFVTVGEFAKILEQLDANGWTLVDINRAVRAPRACRSDASRS